MLELGRGRGGFGVAAETQFLTSDGARGQVLTFPKKSFLLAHQAIIRIQRESQRFNLVHLILLHLLPMPYHIPECT